MSKNISISIILFSNNLENIKKFINTHAEQSSDTNNFEILARVDEGDKEIIKYYETVKISGKINIKYEIKRKLNYFQGWIGNNDMIPFASESSKLISCYGDRIYPETKNWDKILLEKLKITDNKIFRLCYSDFNLRTYKDFWEACFAPSNIFFVSKEWIKINKDFGTCFSHDAYSQCVSYYVEKFDSFNSNQYQIDIPCSNIKFTGQAPQKKSDELEYQRVNGQIKSWSILVSGKKQKEAKLRAMLIIANMIMHRTKIKFNISIDKLFSRVILISDDKSIKYVLNYNVSSFYLFLIKFYRISYFLNFTGGGFYENKKSFLFNITYYLSRRYFFLKGLNDFHNHIIGAVFTKK